MNKTKFIVASVTVWMCTAAVAGQLVIHQLDKATAKQCRTHDWPASADQIHRDWCIGNGYDI